MKRDNQRASAIWVAVSAAIMLVLSGCSVNQAASEKTVLTFADAFSPTHPVGIAGSQPFIDYVNEHGRDVGLEIDAYSAGSLGSPEEIPTLLQSGAVDLGYFIPANAAEQLPLSNVGNLPGLAQDPCLAADAMLPMMQPGGKIYEDELSEHGFLSIWGQGMPNMEIMTSDTKVESPDDVPGLVIAAAGGQTDRVLKGLGAAPVAMGASDYYEGVARGVVDGVMTAKYASVTYGLQQEIRYSTLGANLGVSSIFMSMGDGTWRKLNHAQRKVLIDAGRISQDNVCKGFRDADDSAITELKKGSVEFSEVADDNRAEWDAVRTSIRDQWAEAAKSRNIPANDVLSDLESRITKLEEQK